MADKRSNVKIDSKLHEEMKNIVKLEGDRNTITEEYEKVIRNYIKNYYQEKVIEQSDLEGIIDKKIKGMDKHLSSMLGRNGMDTSMILIGMIKLLANYFETTEDVVQEKIRKEGAIYFTSANSKNKQ